MPGSFPNGQAPTGEAVDTVTVEKGTLFVRKRSIKQGPVAIELSFEGGKATGTMAMGGPVEARVGRSRRPAVR